MIPVVDMTGFAGGGEAIRARIAREFGRAFEDVGFVALAGHGVPEAIARQAYSLAAAFFALPLAAKLAWAAPEKVKSRGYLPMGIESVARTLAAETPPDLCEALVFSAMQLDPPGLAGAVAPNGNIYPGEPAGLATAMRDYFMALHGFVPLLMEMSALALDLPADYFAPYYAERRGTLRAVFYPDQQQKPLPGQLRYGAHHDYGGLTILRQDAAPGGLQVQTVAGDWVDVPPVPGAFTINVGELLSRWTNGRWRSTLHRVMNPPPDANGSTARLSLVFFTGPADDAVIDVLPSCIGPGRPARYPPTRTCDFIRAKLTASMQ